MASFRSHTFEEGGMGNTTFPVWARKARSTVLDLPGANNDIIQRFGRKSDTLAMLVTMTKSELDALYGDVNSSGSLVYHYGTFTAYLDSISDPHEVLAGDLYVCTLNFLRE
jgi:hypothetical protein